MSRITTPSPMEEETKSDAHGRKSMKVRPTASSVGGIRRNTTNRIIAPPPSHGVPSAGVPAIAATPHGTSTGADRPTSLKRSHAHFQESTPAAHLDDRDRLKRIKAITPSQVVADEMAKVRLMSRAAAEDGSGTFTIHEPMEMSVDSVGSSEVTMEKSMDTSLSSSTQTALESTTNSLSSFESSFAAVVVPSAIPSSSSTSASLSQSQPDSSTLLSPTNDLTSSASSTSGGMDELCCESLDDVADAYTPASSPVEDARLTECTETAQLQQEGFYLPPSIYRQYHPKQPLIVSIETALEPYDPDLELQMWDSEQQFQPYLYYLIYQIHLDSAMRPVLVDWMMEVAAEYVLNRETLYLAINYVDRFLSASPAQLPADGTTRSVIDRKTLQLLGVTCLWIAAKVEEMYPPVPEDFAVTTDKAYNAQQVLAMEPVVLQVLNWRLHAVTPFAWLKMFLKKAALLMYEEFQRRAQFLFESSTGAAGGDPASPGAAALPAHEVHQQFSLLQLGFLAEMEYLLSAAWFVRMMEYLDVLALDMHSLRFYPSHLAAAVLFVVHPPGSALHELIQQATTYTAEQLQPAIAILTLFKDMPHIGMPAEHRQPILNDLKVPYDEYFSRQVHNPEGINTLNAALDTLARRGQASAAASSGLAASSAQPIYEDGLEAYCHTNIFRNLPAFLDGNLWSELGMRKLLRPIRNSSSHQLPGLWVTDPKARHDDPRTYNPVGLPEQTGLEDYLDPETIATIMAAVGTRGKLSASVIQAMPVQPATESFMAAARKPYTRLPKEAVRAGQQAPMPHAKGDKRTAATVVPADGATAASGTVQMHSSSSAAMSSSVASSTLTTIYTFGGTNSSTASGASSSSAAAGSSRSSHPTVASSSSKPPVPPAPSRPPARATSTSSSVATQPMYKQDQPENSWLTSDDEEDM